MAPSAKGGEAEKGGPSGPEARAARRKAAQALLKNALPASDEEDEVAKKPKAVPAVGSVHHGAVVSLATYGAFVALGGGFCDGLAHVSQLTAGRAGRNLRDPEEILSIGDRVWALVTEIKDTGKVALSLKAVNQETGKLREPKDPTSKDGDAAGAGGTDASTKSGKEKKATKAVAGAKISGEDRPEKDPDAKPRRTTHGGTVRRNGALTSAGREATEAKRKADGARRKAEAAKAAMRAETAERSSKRAAAGKGPKARKIKHKRHKIALAEGRALPKSAAKVAAKSAATPEELTKRAEKRRRQMAKRQEEAAAPAAKKTRAGA